MIKLSIPDMNCGHCKASVEKAVAGVDPAASVGVDLGARSVEITTGAGAAQIIAALKTVGFDASVIA